ncbi:MAG: carboxypeptidase-like regulatory domain-containing protein [Acidobacteriota bacterium]|nr:carboxypeptidase-like regulatory domain-containing protein [Acidobacteriota bacterium]
MPGAVPHAVAQVVRDPQVVHGQQQPAVAAPTGSVSGRIVCGDTQRPARFAEVMLTGVVIGSGGSDRNGPRIQARTDLDGQFAAGSVPVGDYYVTASAMGYVSQSTLLTSVLLGADAQSVLASVPVVHVSAGTTATVNLTLERGAVIAGKMLWDDGSPAAGVQINAVAQTTATPTGGQPTGRTGRGGGAFGFSGVFGSAATDDRGQFRLTGLAAGGYVLRATVIAPMTASGGSSFSRNMGITLYSPGKVRKGDAVAITVRAGEERDDVPFQLDLHALHRISGRVSAVSGGVSIGSGFVRIVDSQDNTLNRTGQISTDGSYVLSYVPPGTYTLAVPAAGPAGAPVQFGRARGDQGQGVSSTPTPGFQPFQQTITVGDGDVSGVNIELTPMPPQP